MRTAPIRWYLACLLVVLAATSPARASLPFPTAEDGTPTLAPMLREVTPAVVNISVRTRVAMEDNPLLRDPFFRRFFDLPDQPRTRQSAGSGVIVDAERGYVLTNHHVIRNADEVVVTLQDRRSFPAQVIGSDGGTDVALLQIEASALRALPVGDSEALEVGDFVVAIGNPFGLGQTVTSGIVSALGRSGLKVEGYEDFIQTDASINPGNSGGALVNLRGELVGINTAIIAPAGGNVGIGFAIPTSMATSVMNQLLEHGEVRRGRLGVLIQDLTPEIAEALGLDVDRGAVITQVQSGSSAERADLQAGDVVVEIDGREITGSSDLRNRIGLIRVGERIRLTVVRNGERLTVRARVGEGDRLEASLGERVGALQGASFSDLGPGHPLHGQVEGVVVGSVEQGSPAWRSGLREDDLVVAVNRQRITSVEQFDRVLGQPASAYALNVLRGNTRLFIVVQ